MISYATVGVKDLNKSVQFYSELFAGLGAKVLIKMDRIVFLPCLYQSMHPHQP